MLAHRYQIWPKSWGRELDPEDDKEKRYVGVTVLAKRDRHSPFEVFNELLAMRLGQLAGLPVATGLVVERDGNPYFASCHLLAAGGELPAADFDRFATDKPHEACGVTVFDAWIANTDRHGKNMWYDYYGGEFFLLDHGRSLLGGSGRVHLLSQDRQLGIRLDEPCLAPHIRSFSGFAWWYEAICAISPNSIRAAALEASRVGIEQDLAIECASWLLKRRHSLPALFRSNIGVFPHAAPTLHDPFGAFDDFLPEWCI